MLDVRKWLSKKVAKSNFKILSLWKTDFLFIESETSNFGYVLAFLKFPLTVQSFSKIEQQ